MLLRTLLTLSLLIFRLHCRLGSILLAEQVPVHGVVHGAPREQRIQRYLQQVSTSSLNFLFLLNSSTLSASGLFCPPTRSTAAPLTRLSRTPAARPGTCLTRPWRRPRTMPRSSSSTRTIKWTSNCQKCIYHIPFKVDKQFLNSAGCDF